MKRMSWNLYALLLKSMYDILSGKYVWSYFFLKPYKYRIYEIYIGICVNTTAQKRFLKASYKPINNGHLLWDQELKDEGGISFLSWFTLLHYVVFFKR